MIQAPQTTREDFEYWLVDMDDALGRFFASVPKDVRSHLDYTPESLEAIEDWILRTYKSIDEMRPMDQAQTVDGAARYIGETFRKNLGGRWDIRLDNPKVLYFGRPILTGYPEGPVSPLSLTTATASRRTGKYLKGILDNLRTRDT